MFRTPLSQFQSNVWSYYLPVPADIAAPFIQGEDRRVVCHLNGTHQIHTSLMPRHGDYFILINQQLRDKLGIALGDEVEVRLKKDHSEYGMPMPEELAVMLQQDPEGDTYFHALTPGKQRSLIYLVSKVKNTNSRINKALAIVHHLKEAQGKLDFKALNVLIKHYNQQR